VSEFNTVVSGLPAWVFMLMWPLLVFLLWSLSRLPRLLSQPLQPAPPPAPAPPAAPTAAPVPAPESWGYPAEMVDAICGQEGFGWDCGTALSVSWCEQGQKWNPAAINPYSGTRGIFQIHPLHAGKWADYWDAWMNPYRNAQYAHEIWLTSGWGPWACR
jgi:hypothetical protein